jgi:glycosyltransferase involved in cell wall biosynthesis
LNKQSKILFVLPSSQCGGAEKVIFTIIENLSRKRFLTALVLINSAGPLLSKTPNDVSLFSLNRKRVSRSFFPILTIVWRLKPEIILTSIFHLNLAFLILKPLFPRKTKVVIRESNLPSFVLRRERSPKLFNILIKQFYSKADRIICLGNSMRDDLIRNFRVPPKIIRNIENPVDINVLKKLSHEYKNPFDKNRFNYLAVGSLTSQKGFDILIDAMELIVKERLNVHLSILGDGPLKDELYNLIVQKGLSNFISLYGFVNNPYPYFYHADRFILSSRYEGMPNVVLESLALGTPVIAFDNPGCIRDIITNIKQGILVKPCTADVLAREMLNVCRLGTSEQKESLLPEKFLLENVIKRYEDLLESV